MNNRKPPPIPFFFPLFISSLHLFSTQTSPASANQDQYYQTCGNTFSCGGITGIGYPFRGSADPLYCGYPGLVLECTGNDLTTINIANQTYDVLQISPSLQTMTIARDDVIQGTCPSQLANITLDFSLFDYAANYVNLTFLYGCPWVSGLPGLNLVSCTSDYVLYGAQGPGSCNASVIYPVLKTSIGTGGSVNTTGMGQLLQGGFEIRWKVDGRACSDCISSKGRCGYDFGTKQTTCFCPDPPYLNTTCSLVAAPAISPPSGTSPVLKSSTTVQIPHNSISSQ